MTTIEKIKEMSAAQLSEFVPKDLEETVAYLQVVHPLRNPDSKVSERELWIEVGRQQLIEFLINTLNKHEDITDVWTQKDYD